MFDVAIIGAGLAGLSCAQRLHQAGYRVVVLEKSRGVGGRMATRRLYDTRADHGVRYLEPQGTRSQQLIETLVQRGILQAWTNTLYELKSDKPDLIAKNHPSQLPRYVAPAGMTAVAKFLATGLEIWLTRRVQSITGNVDNTWSLTLEPATDLVNEIKAKAVVVAIPAPQALMLLEPLAETTLSPVFVENLRSVEYDPCLVAIAGYSAIEESAKLQLPIWNACTVLADSDLAWIGLDSSKRSHSQIPVFVLQSTAQFAKRYLDTEDLNLAGKQLLSRATQLLIPGLDNPDWFQIHRWRYAFPSHALNQNYLDAATLAPLVCCGDWGGGNLIESALTSGLAAAVQINRQMEQRILPIESF